MEFYRRLKIFFHKENRKKFSIVRTIIKAIFSLCVITILPILFFIIFIFKEPREIKPINDYIVSELKNYNISINYATAKITIDKKFRIVYQVKDLKLILSNNLAFSIPNTTFKIKFTDLIKKKVFFSNININGLIMYFIYDENKISNNTLSYDDIKDILYSFIQGIHDGMSFFNKININNSNLFFSNKNGDSIDKLKIFNSDLTITKNNKKVNLSLDLLSSMNDEEKIMSRNSCNILENKNINCKSTLYNLYTSSLFKILNKDILKYSENIEGLFNFEVNSYFENYTNLRDTDFKIYSESGSFYLKDFFSKKINYKNLIIDGDTIEDDNLILNKVTAKLNDDNKNDLDFSLYLNFKNKNFIDLNIDIKNTNFNKMDTFWPVFLEAVGARAWVIQHFKSGNIDDAYVNMKFKYKNNEYNLSDLISEVNFKNTFLDYDSYFPAAKNLEGKAVFTPQDVVINIKSGNIENTKINNGKVYINFLTPISSVNITANTTGNTNDMLYFIDYNSKNEIDRIAKPFINGVANSYVNVDIPLIDDLNLDKVYIKIDSQIKDVNSKIFSDNSALDLNLTKKYNSDIFGLKLDLKNSEIDFKTINFLKNKSEKLSLNVDIEVENDLVLLKNIKSSDNILSLYGNGSIENGNLTLLELYDIKYLDNNFNIKYKDNLISIYGDKIEFILPENVYSSNNFKYDVNLKFNKVIINKDYELRLIDLLYSNNSLAIYSPDTRINIIQEDDNYKIDGEILDFGNFLHNAKINENIVGGNLYFNGNYKVDDELNLILKIKDGFNYITSSVKNTSFFRYILNSDLVSKNMKDRLESENMLSFDGGTAEIIFYDNTLKIKSFALESKSFFGIGIGGKGKIFTDTGKMDFSGVVIPADKLNTLFGLNKIPLINNLLFGGKNGGLFTIGYEFSKENSDSDYNFKLLPVSASGINSLKNAFLLLLLL